MADDFDSSPKAMLGAWAEAVVSEYARSQGYAVIELSLLGPHNYATLPDGRRRYLSDQIFARDGGMLMVEIKFKTSPRWYRLGKRWRHGVDMRHWYQYIQMESESGCPTEIWIVEWQPTPDDPPNPMLLRAPIERLREHAQIVTYSKYKPMVYWDRDVMDMEPLPNLEPPASLSIQLALPLLGQDP